MSNSSNISPVDKLLLVGLVAFGVIFLIDLAVKKESKHPINHVY